MICYRLSLHCPGDNMTHFVKYFILYLRTKWPNTKHPVLFHFVTTPQNLMCFYVTVVVVV